MADKPKFIRKDGRVIPIGVEDSGKQSAQKDQPPQSGPKSKESSALEKPKVVVTEPAKAKLVFAPSSPVVDVADKKSMSNWLSEKMAFWRRKRVEEQQLLEQPEVQEPEQAEPLDAG